MKKVKLNPFSLFPNRPKLLHIFMVLMLFYLLFTTFEIKTFEFVSVSSVLVNENQNTHHRKALNFPSEEAFGVYQSSLHRKPMQELQKVSTLNFNEGDLNESGLEKDKFSEIQKAVKVAWVKGKRMWEEIQFQSVETVSVAENISDSCRHSISVSGSELRNQKGIMMIPCGLTLWSHVTIVGTPQLAHWENDPKITIVKDEDEKVLVSQFMMELQGLKVVDKEEPPKILHFNPRLKGDYSGKPVIEQNTCYRMQWGSSLRCEGWKSRADEDTGN